MSSKATWGEGPWQDEADRKEWVDPATGLPCLANRNPRIGNWCGYVGVPRDHPLFGRSYEVLGHLNVHGKVTYAGSHSADPALWWIGFDCMHPHDFLPGLIGMRKLAKLVPLVELETYRTLAYVEGECTKLAAQLADPPPTSEVNGSFEIPEHGQHSGSDDDDEAHRFMNFYRCDRCGHQWANSWSCQVDDDCPSCGFRHMSPYKSEDLPQG